MIVLQDTRQKLGAHYAKNLAWLEMGVCVWSAKLPVGDYILARESALLPPGEGSVDFRAMFGEFSINPRVSVDTKANLTELCGNLTTDHERFRAECELAQSLGIQLVVLTENTQYITRLDQFERWTESAKAFKQRHGRHRYEGARLAKVMRTMHERYGVLWAFCAPEDAALRVLEILEHWEGGRD